MLNQFEGPEKKLELILCAPRPKIRANRNDRWKRVVRAAGADILSRKSTRQLDAYLLSESSLFVWDDRILMITCGRTTLTAALPEILKFVDRRDIDFVFYERKNLMYPQQQPSDFEQDAACLQNYFRGKSYRLGPANQDHVHLFYSSGYRPSPLQDVTLQILMTDIDQSLIEMFSVASAPKNGRISTLENLFPEMVVDTYYFSPFGYSLNGIRDASYCTIHVTPESAGSYTSFETNITEIDYAWIIRRVVSFFKPKTFSVVLTTSMDRKSLEFRRAVTVPAAGYRLTEKVFYEFDENFAVTFLKYAIPPVENR